MKYDVFLSYATVDDTALARPWAGVNESTWVKCFKAALQQAVDAKLGRRGSANMFLDCKTLRTGQNLNDKITAALNETRIFVALISEGYFHPDSWCHSERNHFINSLGDEPSRQGRVFGVLLDEDGLADWKAHFFADVLAFPFYEKPPGEERFMKLGLGEIDPAFIRRIQTLADDVALRIFNMREHEAEDQNQFVLPATMPEAKGKVFLAAVPGDMEESRTEILNALKAAGWLVEPEANDLPADLEKCRERISSALATDSGIIAYLQIVGAYPWLPGGHDRAQYEAAGSGADRLVFRIDGIDLAKVRNADHRSWLEELPARSITSLKTDLPAKFEQLLRQRQIKDETHLLSHGMMAEAYITVSIARHDAAFGQTLIAALENQSVYADLGAETGAGLEEVFLKLDGFLAVFGNENYGRVETVLKEWRTVLMKYRRPPDKNPPIGILLTDPPPQDKHHSINIRLPGMKVFQVSDAQAMADFVTKTRLFAAMRGGVS